MNLRPQKFLIGRVDYQYDTTRLFNWFAKTTGISSGYDSDHASCGGKSGGRDLLRNLMF